MSSFTTLLRAFILIKYRTNSSQSLLTIIILLLKRQQIVYSLYQKKNYEIFTFRKLFAKLDCYFIKSLQLSLRLNSTKII